VPGHVGNLDQVGAALHRAGHEAGPQAVAAESCRIEAELGGALLDDGGDIAGREPPIGHALIAAVEDATEDRALGDAGGGEPGFHRLDRAGDLAAGDGNKAANAFLVGLRSPR
jgi:hypothetical protein